MLAKSNRENLYPQLQKFIQLDSLGLFNNQFIIGYVSAQLPTPINKYEWRTLFDKLENMKKMVISKVITVQHVMEVILVSLAKTAESCLSPQTHTTGLELRKFMITLDENMNEVTIDSNSLQKKYFQQNNQKELKEEKLYEKYLLRDELKGIREDFSQKRKKLMKNQPLLRQYKPKEEKKQPQTTKNLIQTSQKLRSDVRKALERPSSKQNSKYEKDYKIQRLNEELNIGKKITLEAKMQKPEYIESKSSVIKDRLLEKGIENPEKKSFESYKPLVRRHDLIIKKDSQVKKKEDSLLENSFERKKQEKIVKRQNSPEIIRKYEPIRILASEQKKIDLLKESPVFDEERMSAKRSIKLSDFISPPEEKKEVFSVKIEKQIQKPLESFRVENSFSQYSIAKQVEKQQEIHVQDADLGLQCPICCEKITFLTVCPVACGHLLHKTCLNEYFKSKVLTKNFPIICPEEACLSEITIADVQEYIQQEIKAKYFQFSLHVFVDKNSSTTSWCPTPGCSAVFQVQNNLTKYECMSCQKTYCIKCRCEYHKGMNCQQYQEIRNLSEEDKKFVEFVNGCQFKQCPNCRFWVSKIEGCDHMTCRCTYEFCYRCGGPYNHCNCEDDDYYDY